VRWPLISSRSAPFDDAGIESRGLDGIRSRAAPGWPWVLGYLSVLLGLWTVVGRYWGIDDDAQLYVLQAVARLNPVPLAHDVFLRFESQDRFSVFSALSAQVVALLGVDRAASSLTLLFLIAWLSFAWAIARRLQGVRLALLAIPLLAFIPGWYGAWEVLRYAEPFMTARCAAEALSLAALLALLCSQRALSAALLVLALGVHPLMAFPMVLLVTVAILSPSGWKAWTLLGGALAAGAVVGSYVLGFPDPLIQGAWLETTRSRSIFLFTDQWRTADWALSAQVLISLFIAAAALPERTARILSGSALCIALVGLVLAVVSTEISLKLLLQGQPWRWLWVGRFVATALLPLTLFSLCKGPPGGKAAAGLLASAWLLGSSGSINDIPPIGASGLLCLTSALIWFTADRLSAAAIAGLHALTWAVLAAVASVLLSSVVVAAGTDFSFGHDPMWVQRITDAFSTPGIVVSISAAAWFVIMVRENRPGSIVFVTTAAMLILGAGPGTVRRWTATPHDETHRAKLAHWRALIPVDAEVLWTELPKQAWFLLDRQSYMTISQGAGTVFSSNLAAELQRRALVLSPLVAPGKWYLKSEASKVEFRTLTPGILQGICSDPSLGFVISKDHTSQAVSEAEWPRRGDTLYLYDCRRIRQEVAS